MSTMEIVLLLAGSVIFVLSFLIPAGKVNPGDDTKTLAKEEIHKLVKKEIEEVRGHIDDVVEEAVSYAMEKTERSLERLSNEKIMAVSEYSETVLKEIHKNHEEVMFLYDMLNDKHVNLKNTVSEAAKTAKEVEETKKEAEAVVNSFQQLSPVVMTTEESAEVKTVGTGEGRQQFISADDVEKKNASKKQTSSTKRQEKQEKAPKENSASPEISFMENPDGRNRNERILSLYKQGKSNVAIAKELGLGVGEVKLVIDLYKNL